MLVRVLGVTGLWLCLWAGASQAQGLRENPTGDDFRQAPNAVRGAYLMMLAKRLRPAAPEPDVVVYAARIGTCIQESVTVRGDHDRGGAMLMRQQPLSELAALCALMEQ